jgi:hypothetical protein
MGTLQMPLSRQDADIIGQALDVYATTLMCAPLGLGLEMMVAVRALRDRLEDAADHRDAIADVTGDPAGNVVSFARA